MNTRKKIRFHRANFKKAQALLLVYFVVIVLLTLAVPLLQRILGDNVLLQQELLRKEAFYLAEGGIEDIVNQFTGDIANFVISPTVTRYPSSGVITTTYSGVSGFPGATVTTYIDEAESGQRVITDPDGTQVTVRSYVIHSTCVHPRQNSITVGIHQAFLLRLTSAFQYTVFYNDDLEIIPGKNMTLSGRVHSNSDIYLAADGSSTDLTLDSEYVRTVGNMYNKRKDRTEVMQGDVSIRKAGTGSYDDMDGLDSEDTEWATESQTRWRGTVQSGVHGVTQLATPAVGSIQPGSGHYYYDNAGLRIENGRLYQGAQELVQGVHVPANTVTVTTAFQNKRENKYVNMVNIDLAKLAGVSGGYPGYNNNLPANGLLYATANTGASGEQPGVRLVNGGTLYRGGGLTVVTNDPLYIQGDYNTTNKKPSAVISDSVNILSNGWGGSDAKSTQSLSNRIATATTVNTAFIAGVRNTTVGSYSGGLENYPRLHEDWSGKTLYIRGAFLEMWNSQVAQGPWSSASYSAPNRNWNYDSDLSNQNPPFTPFAVEAQRSAWWKS